MSAHELRTDLATLYAAADAAAAALAAGDPASRRALLRCLLREGMRHVSGGEAQLQPVPFEALQAALLRAAMADAQLSGFDANGPALPKLLHQLVSAGLVGWGGSTSGRRSVVALRADRLLEQLWQQRTAAGAAQPPPRTSALLPRGPHQSSDSGHAALHGQGIPRIPATFSLLGLTDHSCTIRLELTPNPAEQGQRARALTWLQAAVNSAVPGQLAWLACGVAGVCASMRCNLAVAVQPMWPLRLTLQRTSATKAPPRAPLQAALRRCVCSVGRCAPC